MRLLLQDLTRRRELAGVKDPRPSFFLLLCTLPHPRFLHIVLARAGRWAFVRNIPLLPKVFTFANLVLFGLEVSPHCEIGPGLFIPHPVGVVVGAHRIGSNATIFQGVTLGAKELDIAVDPLLRPVLGNNVTLGSGCKVLGGINVGDNVVVGANSVLVESVEPGVVVVGIPARPAGFSTRGK